MKRHGGGGGGKGSIIVNTRPGAEEQDRIVIRYDFSD